MKNGRGYRFSARRGKRRTPLLYSQLLEMPNLSTLPTFEGHVRHMRMITSHVREQLRGLTIDNPELEGVGLTWGNSRRNRVSVRLARRTLVLSRPLLLDNYLGCYTVPLSVIERDILHHAAHILADTVRGCVHDGLWRLKAVRLGLHTFEPCQGVYRI